MEVLDAASLVERLQWEDKEYWVHMDAETPFEKYPAKQHARRVQEKLGVEDGLIYLLGQELESIEDNDMPVPFRQRRYFYYLSGCNEPDCHLTYDIKHDSLTLFIPKTEERRAVYYGPGMTPEVALAKFDVDRVYYADQLPGFVNDWLHHSRNQGNLYALHPLQVPRLPKRFREVLNVVDSTSLQPAMDKARNIKDDHEIKLIRKANDISSQAHREVLAKISKFQNEAQVEGLFRDVCISHQAKQQAYDPIAASGPNAGILHYDANDEDFEDRQLMCLDAGCEYQLYASDITRTFPLSSSWPSKEAQNIYRLVERMQESCIERVAPGVRYLDLHILAHHIAIDGLLALGILHNGTKEEIYKAGTSKAFFLHGLGHHVGLDVHDPGQAELMSVRRGKAVVEQTPSIYPENYHIPVYDPRTCLAPTDPQSSHLEEGMVVTIEPGIYFSVYALNHLFLPSPVHSKYINAEGLKKYLPVGGVRIEDDILVTSKGYENLTTAPKGDAMLKIIQSGQPNADRPWIRRNSARRQGSSNEGPPLLRAPGILTDEPASILKPISRAATMPPEFKQRNSVDFEPFQGPSLFSNFKRSMTTDERIQHWHQSQQSPDTAQYEKPNMRCAKTVCGQSSPGVIHTYMASHTNEIIPCNVGLDHSARSCTKCKMLCEALNRLRQHLEVPEQNTSERGAKPTFMTASQSEKMKCHIAFEVGTETAQKPPIEAAAKTMTGQTELTHRSRAIPQAPQLQHRHSLASFPPNGVATTSSSRSRHSPAPPRTKHNWNPAREANVDQRSEQQQRRWPDVACKQCKLAKIRCRGDPGNGAACAGCRIWSSDPRQCQFFRQAPERMRRGGDHIVAITSARPARPQHVHSSDPILSDNRDGRTKNFSDEDDHIPLLNPGQTPNVAKYREYLAARNKNDRNWTGPQAERARWSSAYSQGKGIFEFLDSKCLQHDQSSRVDSLPKQDIVSHQASPPPIGPTIHMANIEDNRKTVSEQEKHSQQSNGYHELKDGPITLAARLEELQKHIDQLPQIPEDLTQNTAEIQKLISHLNGRSDC